MVARWVLGTISVIAIAAMAGIGFATVTSTASVTVTANAGSFYVQVSGNLGASSLAVGSCTSSVGPGNSITVTSTNMLPGDYCNWTFVFTDPGSIGGNYVTGQYASFSGPGCSEIYSYGIWTTYPIPNLLPANGNYASFWQNETDTGSGLVSGACTATWNVVWSAA
jgi:hypothetical protein